MQKQSILKETRTILFIWQIHKSRFCTVLTTVQKKQIYTLDFGGKKRERKHSSAQLFLKNSHTNRSVTDAFGKPRVSTSRAVKTSSGDRSVAIRADFDRCRSAGTIGRTGMTRSDGPGFPYWIGFIHRRRHVGPTWSATQRRDKLTGRSRAQRALLCLLLRSADSIGKGQRGTIRQTASGLFVGRPARTRIAKGFPGSPFSPFVGDTAFNYYARLGKQNGGRRGRAL